MASSLHLKNSLIFCPIRLGKAFILFSWESRGYSVTALKNKIRFCKSKFLVVLSSCIRTGFLVIAGIHMLFMLRVLRFGWVGGFFLVSANT